LFIDRRLPSPYRCSKLTDSPMRELAMLSR
jgi:hypothetical protein